MSVLEEELSIPTLDLRNLQLITGAMVIGVVTFLVVVAVLTLNPAQEVPPATADKVSSAEMMSITVAVMFLMCFTLAPLVRKTILPQTTKQTLKEAPATAADLARDGLAVFRNLHLIQMALWEGATLFGVVVLFLNGNNGVLAEHPWVWINAAYVPLYLGQVGLAFPTADKVERSIREEMLPHCEWAKDT